MESQSLRLTSSICLSRCENHDRQAPKIADIEQGEIWMVLHHEPRHSTMILETTCTRKSRNNLIVMVPLPCLHNSQWPCTPCTP